MFCFRQAYIVYVGYVILNKIAYDIFDKQENNFNYFKKEYKHVPKHVEDIVAF